MGLGKAVVGYMAIAAILMSMANAESYTVGDAAGWSFGANYTAWISGKTFEVGDKLVFTYTANHLVLEVSKQNYESCVTSSPISSDKSGNTTVSLTAVGKRYFICGTIGHCDQGMKIEIDTLESSSSPPPANPPQSSACKISYAASFAFALTMLAAI